jgi:hypothetical protein
MVGRNSIVEPMFVQVLEWMIHGNLEGMGSVFSLYSLGWSDDKVYRHIAMYKNGGRGFSFGQ